MRNLKRVLSLSLALVMVLGLMIVGTGASAADFTDQDEIVNEDAVNTLVALNIIAGKDDGSYFDPTGIVTRGEMAKMICIALNGGIEPVLGSGTSFTDTANHWASSYIEYCVNLKIVAGRGNGTFDPNATVTATEAAKMLLVAMNYDPTIFGLVGDSWDINTNTEANQAGLYEDLTHISASAGLTRDNAAQMIYNAILAKTMELSWGQNMTTGEISQNWTRTGDSIFADRYDGNTSEGVLTDFDYNADKGEWTYEFTTEEQDKSGDPVVISFQSGEDYTDLFRMNTEILWTVKRNVTTVYGAYPKDSTVLAEGILGDIDSIETDSIEFDGVKYKFDAKTWAGTDIVAFGSGSVIAKADGTNEIKLANEYYDCKLIDNDNDGKVDVIVAHPFTVAKVTYVGKTTFRAGGNTYTIEDVTVYDDIAKDDFVKVVPSANSVDGKDNFTQVETVVEGKVTGTRAGEVKIGDTWYKLADGAPSMAIGNSYDKAAVVNGYIFTGEVSSSAADVDDYAVVVKAVAAADNGMNGDQAKLLLSDGTTKIVDTDKAYSSYEGKLVTWKIEDDEYVLTGANTSDKDVHGFDGYTAGAYDYEKDGKSTIGNMSISDDAVIFVKDGSDYKTVTGAELKKVASITVTGAYYNTNDSTGFNTIVMAYVNGEISSTSDNKYGYVVSSVENALDDDDNTVKAVTFWNGSETVTLQTKYGTDIGTLAKGSFFIYKVNGDNEITSVTVINDKSAITAYDGTYVVLDGVDSGAKMEITDDTVIIYVDSDGVAGAEGGSIELADKDEDDDYINNVAYVVDTANDEVTALFIDVNNEMK